MEKNDHFPPLTPLQWWYFTNHYRADLNHFLYMWGATLPFIFSPKEIKTDATRFPDTVDKVLSQCVLVCLNFVSAMLFYFCCVTLSFHRGWGKQRCGEVGIDGRGFEEVRWSILVVAFHQLFKTLKSCCVRASLIKKAASLKLTFLMRASPPWGWHSWWKVAGFHNKGLFFISSKCS